MLIIVNPLVSDRAKSSSLRKVKTDIIDARHLCELYYKEELEPYKKRGIQLLNLRNLTRQHESMTGMYVQTKLKGFSIEDTAKILGWTESKVKSTLFRAIPALKKQLLKEGYLSEEAIRRY